MTPTTPSTDAKHVTALLGIAGLAAVGYFVFLHSRVPAAPELQGGWACVDKPWNLRFDSSGGIAMDTIGPAQRGSFRLDTDGTLTIDLTNGKHYKTKAAIRNGSLVLTDPDGSSSTFKRNDSVLPAVPVPVTTPNPEPKVSIHGRWVSTESAREVIELSPQGGVRLTTRGEPFPQTGRYDYLGGNLRFTLNMPQGLRTVENRVTSLTDNEMVIFLPALTGLRETRSVTYWRIEPAQSAPLRSKLLGRWRQKEPDGILVEFAADDTLTVTTKATRHTGIYRVVGQTLEYHTTAAPSVPVMRKKLVDVTDRTHTLVNPSDENERWDYVRVK